MAKPIIVFILGGPGSGKGTQCRRISEEFGFNHISAGDCLREEQANPASKYGDLIADCIKAGRIVPVKITVSLLKDKMKRLKWYDGKFLIDGFPRNQDNLAGWIDEMKEDVDVRFCLSLDCEESVLVSRLLGRGVLSGREDDNMDVIKKRLHTFYSETEPIVNWFESEDKCVRVDGNGTVEDVWGKLSELFCRMGFAK